jgi:hypothetical protein
MCCEQIQVPCPKIETLRKTGTKKRPAATASPSRTSIVQRSAPEIQQKRRTRGL